MKRTFSFVSKRNALWCFVLAGLFILLGTTNTGAQSNAAGFSNPYANIAQDFNVTAYPLNTFDREEVIEILEELGSTIKLQMGHNPSASLRLKYKYISDVLNDVKAYSIATEISLLKRLKELTTSKIVGGTVNSPSGSVPPTQYANLYNEIVNELQ